MTRTITAATQTASEGPLFTPILFIELDFSSGFIRLNSTVSAYQFESNTYTGVGDLGEITAVQERGDIQSTSLTVGLQGVDSQFISIALDQDYQGRSAKMWLGFLDASLILIADPTLIFKGRMDTMPIVIGHGAKVQVTIESRLADLFRPRIRRFNNADQQERFPADKGLEFVESRVEKELVWQPAR